GRGDGAARRPRRGRRARARVHAPVPRVPERGQRLHDVRVPDRGRCGPDPRPLAAAEGRGQRGGRARRRHDQPPARRRARSRALPRGREGRARPGRARRGAAGAGPGPAAESRQAPRGRAAAVTLSSTGSRAAAWDDLARTGQPWDLVVAGGGIAGAAVFREAVRRGWRVLLLDGSDFAAGTSSHSSKLVHGGIRYLQHGHWRLTRESLRERDRWLRDAAGLVEPLYFVRPIYRQERSRWQYPVAFLAYGLLAGRKQHRWYRAKETLRF